MGFWVTRKIRRKLHKLIVKCTTLEGNIDCVFASMLRQMRFIKAAKGKKEIRPQAINIGQLEMATDE